MLGLYESSALNVVCEQTLDLWSNSRMGHGGTLLSGKLQIWITPVTRLNCLDHIVYYAQAICCPCLDVLSVL